MDEGLDRADVGDLGEHVSVRLRAHRTTPSSGNTGTATATARSTTFRRARISLMHTPGKRPRLTRTRT
ncbi:MAG: hypothetical protein ACREQ5_34065 [Candidatus Dormibacteria bacterium]